MQCIQLRVLICSTSVLPALVLHPFMPHPPYGVCQVYITPESHFLVWITPKHPVPLRAAYQIWILIFLPSPSPLVLDGCHSPVRCRHIFVLSKSSIADSTLSTNVKKGVVVRASPYFHQAAQVSTTPTRFMPGNDQLGKKSTTSARAQALLKPAYSSKKLPEVYTASQDASARCSILLNALSVHFCGTYARWVLRPRRVSLLSSWDKFRVYIGRGYTSWKPRRVDMKEIEGCCIEVDVLSWMAGIRCQCN